MSLGSRLFVSGDVSLNGLVSVPTQVASDNSTKVATTQYVTTALSAFSGAYATFRGDVSINNRLFVGSDVSLGGNLFVNSALNFIKGTTTGSPTTYSPNSTNATSNSWTASGITWTSNQSAIGANASYFTGYNAFNPNFSTGINPPYGIGWCGDTAATYNTVGGQPTNNSPRTTTVVGLGSIQGEITDCP